MRFDIITLFPSIFDGYLTQGLLAKAIQRDLVQIEQHNLRDWAPETPHRPVDDKPFGGGPGMLIQVEPTVNCVEAVEAMDSKPARRVLLTPQGKTLNQPMAENFATSQRMIVLCGRYEGFDQRVVDILQPEEVSIGDFILSGGEIAALTVMDAVVRLLPGVIGREASHREESFETGLLEPSLYTHPRNWDGIEAPEILASGHHGRIAEWRAAEARRETRERRPDLWERYLQAQAWENETKE